jgi:hypothetical protein
LQVAVTRKVGLYHGRPEFHNREPWGQQKTDEVFWEQTRAGAAMVAVGAI